MSKNNKDPLAAEQRRALKEMHTTQITLEIAFSTLVLALLTINIVSVLPAYGVVAVIAMVLSALILLVFGIILTASVFGMKRQAKPLATRAGAARAWLVATWVSVIAAILLFLFNSPFKDDELNGANLFLLGFALFVTVTSIIAALISTQLMWRRFNKKRRSRTRVALYGAASVLVLVLAIFGSYTTDEVITYKNTEITDSNLELGQSEVRQAGKDGVKQIKRNLLFGAEASSTSTAPVDEITAKGSRKYQYMYCSDGSSRYYTAEQFKDPNTGFTHQSPDYCAENGNGTQTTIADVPPPEKIIQQAPSYNYYRSPSSYTTTCDSYSFSNSITCRTY